MDFCANCGDGITLGHKCVHCGNLPFCDKPSCSETSELTNRICTNCKKEQKLDCLECSKLATKGQCIICLKRKINGETNKITRACTEHFSLLFYKNVDSSAYTYHCVKCCSTEVVTPVCNDCQIPKQSFWSGKKFTCANCKNDLVPIIQMIKN